VENTTIFLQSHGKFGAMPDGFRRLESRLARGSVLIAPSMAYAADSPLPT